MAIVRSYEEIEDPRCRYDIPNGFIGWATHFIRVPQDGSTDSPMAFLAEGAPNEGLRTHFHVCDQFQLVYSGRGTLGKHDLVPGALHFARAYTPYGPLRNDAQEGLGYLTLRARSDPGAQWMPDAREALDRVTNRNPWQVTVMSGRDPDIGDEGLPLTPLEGLHGQPGLAGWSIRLKAGAKCTAPDPSSGEGQYIVVLKGGLQHEGTLRRGLTLVFTGKGESPFELEAGPDGMQGLVLNFPVAGGERSAPVGASLTVWMCVVCGFVYDEAQGIPDEGIPAGTRWADVPDSFGCPHCSATKADFELIEI